MKAVKEFPRPKTKQDLRAFLGLVGYYRRFIPGFSQRSADLTDRTGKSHPDSIQWTEELEHQFQHLRQALAEETALNAFKENRETLIHSNASDKGIGGVLLQRDEGGQEVLVAFFSRKLLPRETQYTVTERECLAIVDTVRHFQAYLIGAKFTVVMDHKALLAIPQTTSGGARVIRWALALQPFDFEIQHKPGKTHGDADGLSRPAEDPQDTLGPDLQDKSPSNPRGVRGGGGCWAQAQNHNQDIWKTLF